MTMKFDKPSCPECGELARGTLEVVPGLALLNFDKDGEAEYDGGTKVDWDGQVTRRDAQGRVTLECSNGHQWRARMDDGRQPGRQQEIDDLLSKAQRLGMEPSDLDEAVYEVVAGTASDINNAGLDGQLGYLIDKLGREAAAKELDRLAAEKAEAADEDNGPAFQPATPPTKNSCSDENRSGSLARRFRCPSCGGTLIEEILANATVASRVEHVLPNGELQYGEQNTSDGVVDRYQCENCGQRIAENAEGLVAVLAAMADENTSRPSQA